MSSARPPPPGWSNMKLGDFIELKRGYDLPHQDRAAGRVPIISSSGKTGFHDRAMVKAPGVVTGRYGTIGQVFFVREDFWPLNTTLYVRDFKGNDPQFASLLLRTIDFLSCSDKAAVPGVNRNHLHELMVVVPSLAEQRAISYILGTIDDKIGLNRRTNETLEAMARALFKSWFVDFDPVHAKKAGRKPEGMHAETAALFPDDFEDSELGPIPRGWQASTLGAICKKIGSGSTPRGGDSAYLPEGVSLIRSQNVYDSGFVWSGLVRISDSEADRMSSVAVESDDVLLNITGASILRTCVVERGVLPARVNQHVMIVRAKEATMQRCIHFHLLLPETKSYLIGLDAGASRQAVTKAHVESVPLVVPPTHVVRKFSGVCEPNFDRIEQLAEEAKTLTALRDALLPQLLSGAIRVPEAMRLAEKAL